MNKELIIGIEIGGTKLQIVSGTRTGEILDSHRFEVIAADGAAGIQRRIEEVLTNQFVGQIAAVGVGFGGPVNRLNGEVATSFQIDGWAGFGIRDWLTSIAGCPVIVDNDANVAALGEATLGAGRDLNPVLYVTLGSGVGAGLVIDHKIYHGILPGELELGHLRMDKSGTIFESRCSGWAVDKKIRDHIQNEPGGTLAKLCGSADKGQAKYLKAAMDSNDPAALRIFDETMDDLAFGLSHAIHLIHPEVIVLGGGLSLVGEELRKAVEHKLPRYLMKAFVPPPAIRLSLLQEMAVPSGALMLATN